VAPPHLCCFSLCSRYDARQTHSETVCHGCSRPPQQSLSAAMQNAVVLDPYAKAVVGRRKFGELGEVRCRAKTSPGPRMTPPICSAWAIRGSPCQIRHCHARFRTRFAFLVPQDIDPGPAAAAGVSRTWPQSAGALPAAEAFDWQGDRPLHLPQASTLVLTPDNAFSSPCEALYTCRKRVERQAVLAGTQFICVCRLRAPALRASAFSMRVMAH